MSISKNTLSFLSQLKQHNNKVWFDDNRSSYVEAKTDIINFVDGLLPQLRKFDEQLEPELSADKCVFRIFRDVRFSANKTPYKSNMGAAINPGGKKAAVPGYYVVICPKLLTLQNIVRRLITILMSLTPFSKTKLSKSSLAI
jgi:uncharacterized protein (TIGR02453 family)